MANRICPHCRKKDVHHKATMCPYCQKAIQPLSFWKTSRGKILIVFGGLWLFGLFATQMASTPQEGNQTQTVTEGQIDKANVMREKTLERLREQFIAQKTAIITEIESLYHNGKYKKVREKATPYLFIKDADLQRIFNKATEKKLLANAKRIPGTDLDANKKVYAELVRLNPREEYKKKLAYYEGKIQKREKEAQERLARFGQPPERTGWTGEYYIPVERYLKKAAHDPSSIEFEGCTDVYSTDKGWVVGCIYRGKNAFGALVKNANWFVIRHNQVIDVKPETAYKW